MAGKPSKAGSRKAGIERKTKTPKRNRKGIFARDRSRPIRRQQHGYTFEVATDGDTVNADGVRGNLVPRFHYVKHVDTTTALRAAFEAAGHPRCKRNRFGHGRAPGWWVYRKEAA